MKQNIRPQVLGLIRHHQDAVLRIIRARNAATMGLIRRSRHNLEEMERASLDFFRELYLFGPALAVMNVVPRIRTIGSKERSSEWWDRDVLQTDDDGQWIEYFRMDRTTFFRLVDLVRDELAVSDIFMPALTVEKKVAIAGYKLASCAEYCAVGKGFGVSKSTVCNCVHKFCKALISTQSRHLLSWPSHEECKNIARAFEEKYSLPNVIGVIDGTHVPITPPEDGGTEFHNRKGYSSIVVQVVVDHNMFRNVTAQHPGCNHDASVFRDSYLYCHHDTVIPQSDREIDGLTGADDVPLMYQLPYYIIVDPAYPISDWLMKDYRNERNAEEESFNLYLNKARILVEIAIGRLKGRWRILCKKSGLDVLNMPHVIIACCILHNFIEMSGLHYLPQWDQRREEDMRTFPQPPNNPQVENNVSGVLMRDHLCAYMARNFPLLQSRDI